MDNMIQHSLAHHLIATAVRKRAKHTNKLVLLLKAILVSTPIFVLLYDGWSTFQPLVKLTFIGYATIVDGDTLKVTHLLPLPLKALVLHHAVRTSFLHTNKSSAPAQWGLHCFF